MDSAHQHFAIAVGAARDQAKELLSQLERQAHGQTGKSRAMYLVLSTIRGGPEPSSSSGREDSSSGRHTAQGAGERLRSRRATSVGADVEEPALTVLFHH
jgi:hypothetical protein